MMSFVMSALKDADVFLLVTDIGEDFKNQEILETVKDSLIPTIIIINKIDLSDQETVELKMKFWKEKFPAAEVIPVSALLKFNMEKVVESILDKLPDSPPYFPKDEISDKTMRFFASEIIREKIFEHYQKEIPYACEVIVDSYKEEPAIDKISATIYVERDSQKGIVIGHKGSALKIVGTEARLDLEEFLQKKVFLELHVKVNKDWRNSDTFLKRFGYEV
jgi:GTP-binding protein Era